LSASSNSWAAPELANPELVNPELVNSGLAKPKADPRPPLHVVTLTPFYPSETDDATGCFVSEPLAALSTMNVQNTVFVAHPIYRKRFTPRDSPVSVRGLKYLSLPGNFGLPGAGAFLFARAVGAVRKIHACRRIDVIHAHGPLPCGHAAMLLGAELNIPYVVTVHGLDAFSVVQVRGRAGEWCRRISQRVYRSSRRVICISEHVREAVLEGMGGSCRTSVVYNGVDPELFNPGATPPPATGLVLTVGNLIPTKGYDALIRAAGALAAEFPALRWEIIGDGPERARLQGLCTQVQVADKVRFLGRQTRRQVAAAMQGCTLFALPSRYEGLGCVYLEAMSSGKPAIGCRGQGIAEVIQHGSNGFLVGPDNEKELALAIAMLLKDERRRQNISAAARDTILERFTLIHQAESLLRIYREAAE
jgi:teichuronic acid biosynthesis glycosyltransferase TuaC